MTHATSNTDEVGFCSNDVILRGGGFLVFGIVTALAVTKPPGIAGGRRSLPGDGQQAARTRPLKPKFALFLAQVIEIVCTTGVGLSTQ